MAIDDYLEPEVAVAVAVTAAVCSPPVRRVLRRGLVYGLAGLIVARDKVSSAAQAVTSKAKEVASAAGNAASAASTQAASTSGAATS
jgi:hypothetical protein